MLPRSCDEVPKALLAGRSLVAGLSDCKRFENS
jgi:hypothetical protein